MQVYVKLGISIFKSNSVIVWITHMHGFLSDCQVRGRGNKEWKHPLYLLYENW